MATSIPSCAGARRRESTLPHPTNEGSTRPHSQRFPDGCTARTRSCSSASICASGCSSMKVRGRLRLTLDELCNERVGVPSGLRTVIEDQLRKHGRTLNVAAEVDSVEAIRRMVMRGQATTLMPASTFRDDVQARRLDAFHVANASLYRLLVIAQPLSGRDTPAIRQVADTLARQFATLSEEGVFRLLQRDSRKPAKPTRTRT